MPVEIGMLLGFACLCFVIATVDGERRRREAVRQRDDALAQANGQQLLARALAVDLQQTAPRVKRVEMESEALLRILAQYGVQVAFEWTPPDAGQPARMQVIAVRTDASVPREERRH